MLLYLARHAQTASSAVDSFNGRGELPLTERGREQARKLGERLSGVRFAAVFRSPLGRTKDTAELIVPGLRQVVLEGLSEIDYGEWEGLSPQQARERDPELYDAWVADPSRIAPPGGETATQVAERVLSALREIEERFAGAKGPVLAVSHKATLRILGAAITSAPIALYRKRWSQDECALNLIELRKDSDPFLRLWNDTAHLAPDPALSTRSGH
ncbi:MAG TPA: histidine phosphatase family protein [Myxococcales bacterium]|nr:histidine phosphatase family protein [Myxococcales bacterium]